MSSFNVASSAVLTATGMLKNHNDGELGGVCVKAIYMVGTDEAGTVTFRDGGEDGPVRLVLPTSALSDSTVLTLPGQGVSMRNGAHVTLDGVGSLVVFYG